MEISTHIIRRVDLHISWSTVYQETLTKGKFDEFDESWPNCQTKPSYKRLYYFIDVQRESKLRQN